MSVLIFWGGLLAVFSGAVVGLMLFEWLEDGVPAVGARAAKQKSKSSTKD